MTNQEKDKVKDIERRLRFVPDYVTAPRAVALAWMAFNGIYPDGSFGDDECTVWAFMRAEFGYPNTK